MGRKKKSEEDESAFITIADARASMRRGSTTREKSHRIFSDATLDKLKDAQRDISARTRLDREGQFLKQSRAVHGDKYDYSKVEYVNSSTKVTIICPVHGEFQQKPISHSRGMGCAKCSGIGLSLGERIEKFREVHGDRYDYSKVEWVNNKTNIKIICPDHGEFEQTPVTHQKGSKCPKCAHQSRKAKRSKTTAQIIAEFKDVHGDRYDYSKVDYVNDRTKVTIICRDHGEFSQRPNQHLKGEGCRSCGIQRAADKRRGRSRVDTNKVIEQFRDVHGDRYDYSKVEYQGPKTKVIIICPDHGEFQRSPRSHKSGRGCPVCSKLKPSKNLKEAWVKRRDKPDKVIQQFRDVHGDRYDYSKVEYVNLRTKVTIICPVHGEFQQNPYSHKKGTGCRKCYYERQRKT